jgi:hypothetical protein
LRRPQFELRVTGCAKLHQILFTTIVQLDAANHLGVAAVQRLGKAKDRRERTDALPPLGTERAVLRVAFRWRRLAVITGDKRDDLGLLRFEAAQISILDQVIRMFVMSRVTNVRPDIVEQRGELEPFPLPIGEPMDAPCLVEHRKAQPRDLIGMLGPVAAAFRQLDHAAPPDVGVLAGLRDVLTIALNIFEDEPFAKREVAQRNLAGIDVPQNRVEQHAAGDDEVGAARVEPGKLHALGNASAGQFLPQAMDLFGGDAKIPDFIYRTAPFGGSDRAEAEDRSRRADDTIEPGRANVSQIFRQLLVDMPDHFSLVTSGERIAADETFGQPNHPELEALCGTQRRSCSVRDFDAAPADVHHDRSRAGNIDAVDRGKMDEPGFFGSGNDLRPDSRFALDRREEFAAVFGFADRAGRRREDFFDLMRLGEPPESRKRLEGGLHRFIRQGFPVQAAGSKPYHLLFPIDHLEGEVRSDADDDHVNRVGPAVDRCYPHLFEMKRVAGIIESSYNGRRNDRTALPPGSRILA